MKACYYAHSVKKKIQNLTSGSFVIYNQNSKPIHAQHADINMINTTLHIFKKMQKWSDILWKSTHQDQSESSYSVKLCKVFLAVKQALFAISFVFIQHLHAFFFSLKCSLTCISKIPRQNKLIFSYQFKQY